MYILCENNVPAKWRNQSLDFFIFILWVNYWINRFSSSFTTHHKMYVVIMIKSLRCYLASTFKKFPKFGWWLDEASGCLVDQSDPSKSRLVTAQGVLLVHLTLAPGCEINSCHKGFTTLRLPLFSSSQASCFSVIAKSWRWLRPFLSMAVKVILMWNWRIYLLRQNVYDLRF